MATVKVKFRASSIPSKEGALYYRVNHNRQMRNIPAGYKVFADEWDEVGQEIVLRPGIEESRFERLSFIKSAMANDLFRLNGLIERLENSGYTYTVDDVAELYASREERGGFISFARQIIIDMRRMGRVRTSETYTTALHSFTRFRQNREILFFEINASLMCEYEVWLKRTGICLNSMSFYMRNLRAIYNRAVESGLTAQRNPFKHVYTGVGKTVKRAIPLNVIRQIRNMDLSANPAADFARDMFMFSFYTRGMAFVDMAYLRKSDLKNGVLTYRRQKTGQQLFIKWEKPMQEIVVKYDTSDTPFMLPVIRDMTVDDRRQYLTASHLVNNRLKKLGRQLGLVSPLTSYVARHTWASIAKSRNIPISVISEAMGHDSETTTRIYLASLDNSAVDKANLSILKLL